MMNNSINVKPEGDSDNNSQGGDWDNNSQAGESSDGVDELRDVDEVDKLFFKPSLLCIGTWLLLLALVYGLTPVEQWVYLDPGERNAGSLAMTILLVVEVIILIPLLLRPGKKMSGIFFAALTVHFISCTTNGILAFCPNVLMVDQVTNARVFFIRWCEWIPTAGLMTFLAGAIDMRKGKKGYRTPVLVSVSQSLSCVAGILLPLASGNILAWCTVMFFSIVLWAVMFPRLVTKRRDFLSTPKGKLFEEKDRYNRVLYAYQVMLSCTIVWSGLVAMYFLNLLAHKVLPEGHIFRFPSLSMWIDTSFDVVAKAVYMRVITEIHCIVFDTQGRTQRQLNELRRLMSVLWYSSSDVIIISVRHGKNQTSMLSPSFPTLVGATLPEYVREHHSPALVIETHHEPNKDNSQTIDTTVSASFFVDSSEMPCVGEHSPYLAKVERESRIVEEALGIIGAIWRQPPPQEDFHSMLLVHPVNRMNSDKPCRCEIKVSRQDGTSVVGNLRDATERYRRFEAERKAHMESMARQKDAQAVNRFTRHEIKNGLLSGIELCDSLLKAVGGDANVPASTENEDRRSEANSAVDIIKELDQTLCEVLDTVLDGAMAREVIHETYQPRREVVNIRAVLETSMTRMGNNERFPLEFYKDDFPGFLLDPQLIRYIHRNAISNACKYGKSGGVVKTEVDFNAALSTLEIRVINEPGSGHDKLLSMGREASESVFSQGSRLHLELNVLPDSHISSGDGAWIMKKCAKTLCGDCDIQFEPTRTVLRFWCEAPLVKPERLDFKVPEDTWGIGIDDSKMQMKLLDRVLAQAGIAGSRRIILGAEPSDVEMLGAKVKSLLTEYPSSKILVFVDENLDYRDRCEEDVFFSGSLIMKGILTSLKPDEEARVLALVRSANDSSLELSEYVERTHGFFPKAPMAPNRVREVLAPMWSKRFQENRPSLKKADSVISDSDSILTTFAKKDLVQSLDNVDRLLLEDGSRTVLWSRLWALLHGLKGDLMVMEESFNLQPAIELINSMKGRNGVPVDFTAKWDQIHDTVTRTIESM